MAINLSGTFWNYPILGAIDQNSSYNMTGFRLYKGTLPVSLASVLNDSDCLSSGSLGGTVGTQNLPYSSNNMWSSPSSGVIILSAAQPIYIRGSGLPASPIPGFIRFFRNTEACLDIEVSNIRESKKASISSVAAVTASQVLALMDIRFKINVSGPLSFNNAFAGAILKGLTVYPGQIGNTNVGSYGLFAGFPYCQNDAGAPTAVAITAEAYDGPVPASCNDEATGTKLWSKSYSSTTGANIWSANGNSLELVYTFTANAIASGTPTYVRITKSEYTTGSARYPRMVVQAPIGIGVGYAQFSANNFVAGSSVSLNSFVISFDVQ